VRISDIKFHHNLLRYFHSERRTGTIFAISIHIVRLHHLEFLTVFQTSQEYIKNIKMYKDSRKLSRAPRIIMLIDFTDNYIVSTLVFYNCGVNVVFVLN
jgi:hypothetical protein